MTDIDDSLLGLHQANLTRLLRAMADAYPPQPNRRHASIEALVLEHRRWFTPAPLPPDRPRGRPQRCYGNATLHSETYGLLYVEGFAIHTSGSPAMRRETLVLLNVSRSSLLPFGTGIGHRRRLVRTVRPGTVVDRVAVLSEAATMTFAPRSVASPGETC